MSDVFDIEAFLDANVGKNKKENGQAETKDATNGSDSAKDRGVSKERGDKDDEGRRQDKDRDREREKDKDRDRDRKGRDRSRSPRRDRDRDRRRRSDSRDRDRDRERHRSRRSPSSSRSRSTSRRPRHRRRSSRDSRSRSRDSRHNSRSRSPYRKRGDKDRRSSSKEKEKTKSSEGDKPKEVQIAIDVETLANQREAERRKREIEDLTKDQRTIFVSQLTKKVNESDLERFFGQIGPVKSVIMLRDKFSGAHKGFAYVEMEDLDHIPNCLLFNNVVPDFQKFPILVKASEAEKNFLAKKDPFSKQYEGVNGPDTRIYVGNIHISLDETALKSVLEQFGPIESVKIHRDHLGNSKGFAFVKFLRSDSASIALAALPGLELAGRALKVGHVTDHKASSEPISSGGSSSMNPSFSSDPLNSSGNWKLDADDGGAGLALNAHSRMMLMAKLAQNAGIQMPTATMPVIPNLAPPAANPNASKPVPVVAGTPSRFVLINNMFDPATETDPNWDQEIKEDVMEECSNFGPVEHCYVERVKPGGLVFIKMKAIDAATKAANALNGRYFAGRMITCSFLDEKTFLDMTR